MAPANSDLGPTRADLDSFVAAVREHYRQNRRDLPWRRTHDPYEILVSEIMLQQTQVARVLNKYEEFLGAFPTVQALAAADVGSVLSAWQGLGYNRRALALHRAAQTIVDGHEGRVPESSAALRGLPGVGAATAAAVGAFAFGRAEPFIETNIRSAFLHFFFQDQEGVADVDILPLVEATLDREDPREWFYALMDFGVWVKREHANPGRRSRHHAVQSPFGGSRREARAQVLRAVLAAAPSPVEGAQIIALLKGSGRAPSESLSIADALVREGFLRREGDAYHIVDNRAPAAEPST